MPAPTQGLFMTHQRTPRLVRHWDRLVAQTWGLIDWIWVDNAGNGAAPRCSLTAAPAYRVMGHRYREMVGHGGVQGGRLDVVLIPLIAACSSEHVWVMEYDVDFSGPWSDFFSAWMERDTDLVTTRIRSYEQSTEWCHWSGAQLPEAIPRHLWRHGFHPLCRLSQRFARWYAAEMQRAPWGGHYELTLPTAAAWGGFSLEDLADHGWCTPESFTWRPWRPHYWHETPERFPQSGQLYHPIKAEVPVWGHF